MPTSPIFLVGPTGVGKSQIAVFLAQDINAEIVSCDSMQVYKGMDIATDKPPKEYRNKVKHHLIDIVDISEEYDVARYIDDANNAIRDINRKGKISLVIGGTGLYIRALVDGFFTGPGSDTEIRAKLEKRIKEEGLDLVYEELKKIDPVAVTKIHSKDKRRIIRALEVYYITGKPISSFQSQWEKKRNSPNPTLKCGESPSGTAKSLKPEGRREARSQQKVCIIIGLNRLRKDLYQRIDRRVDEMFDKGLVEETKQMLERGLMQNKTSCQALGYKEIMEYLAGKYSLEEAKDLLKRNTRRFAKRQLTWFLKDDRVKWFLIREDENLENITKNITGFLKENSWLETKEK